MMNSRQDAMSATARAAAIRKSYTQGIRSKGFSFSIPSGQTTVNLGLTGMGSEFLGFAFLNIGVTNINCQLVINNDVVVEAANAAFYNVNGTQQPRNYYEMCRKLNGQDTINMTFSNAGQALTINIIVYYIGANL